MYSAIKKSEWHGRIWCSEPVQGQENNIERGFKACRCKPKRDDFEIWNSSNVQIATGDDNIQRNEKEKIQNKSGILIL